MDKHPIYEYHNILKNIEVYTELERTFGFTQIPSLGELPELPSIELPEEIPVIPIVTRYPDDNKNKVIESIAPTNPEIEPPTKTDVVARSTLSPQFKQQELEKLQQNVEKCNNCRLALTRTNTVFGYGNPNAELVFIGEAPGAQEDKKGVPFVGKAGQLLTRIIESIQYTREEVYIMNLIKCRPPQNRDPKPDEVEQCKPFFLKQLNYLEPKLICTLGRFASQSLLDVKTPISRMRGQTFYWHSIPVIPTFHPSYLLRNESEKRKVWEDMKKIRDMLKE